VHSWSTLHSDIIEIHFGSFFKVSIQCRIERSPNIIVLYIKAPSECIQSGSKIQPAPCAAAFCIFLLSRNRSDAYIIVSPQVLTAVNTTFSSLRNRSEAYRNENSY